MARTKQKPPPSPKLETNGLASEVLTLGEVAAYLRLSESDVLQLVKDQGLAGRQIAQEWRFLKAAIENWLQTGQPRQSNKEAWLALAGVWKDDPYVEEELKEIYRRRASDG